MSGGQPLVGRTTYYSFRNEAWANSGDTFPCSPESGLDLSKSVQIRPNLGRHRPKSGPRFGQFLATMVALKQIRPNLARDAPNRGRVRQNSGRNRPNATSRGSTFAKSSLVAGAVSAGFSALRMQCSAFGFLFHVAPIGDGVPTLALGRGWWRGKVGAFAQHRAGSTRVRRSPSPGGPLPTKIPSDLRSGHGYP